LSTSSALLSSSVLLSRLLLASREALVTAIMAFSIADVVLSPYFLILLPALYFILPLLTNTKLLRVPGPFAAKASNLWLMYASRNGRRFRAVDAAHKKYGKVVRIQPNHVSIADADAIQTIYGHGNGFLKALVLFPDINSSSCLLVQ